MIIGVVTFLCGILLFQCLSVFPSALCMIFLCCCGAILVIARFSFAKQYKKTRYVIFLVTILLLSFLYALVVARSVAKWELPASSVGKRIVVTGYVSSLPEQKLEYSKFHFATDMIAGETQQTNLLLSWYGAGRPQVRAGEKWQLLVKLKRPHGLLNPGGFDYEKYLWQQHIRATGYVVVSPINKRAVSSHFSVRYFNLLWRQLIAAKLDDVLASQPLLGIIDALVLGKQSGVSKQQWQVFRDTGTSYLMAIAGLHISLVAGVVFALIQFLWRFSRRLTLWLPAKKAAVLCGLFAAVIYSLLSGFSIPTQRALIMLLVFAIAALLQRHTNVWYVLCMSLLFVLLFDPMSVLAVGFWLSFIAVVLIFYVTAGRLQLSHVYWRKYLRMQGTMTVGLAPFTLLFFAQASATTFIANIFALPMVCLIVVPMSLFGSMVLLFCENFGYYILLSAEKIMELVWWGLQWLSQYSQFNWHHAVFAWWQVVFAIGGIFLLLTPRGVFGKYAGLIWCCPLLFCVPEQPKFGEIWFSMLDVGEGLATVIQTQQHVLVYDTGPKFADSDVGESVVVPFLQQMGVRQVDAMVVSHGDDDHSGGALSILRLMPVAKVITSVPEKFPAAITQKCFANQSWQWDGVNFSMLSPPAAMPYSGNNSSCVLRVDNGKQSILLTGDIEHIQEKILLQQNAATSLASSIVTAPHHGSASSSSPDFVNAVNAQYVLFSAGYANRFHFPARTVVARYQMQGAKELQTQDSGTITFRLKKDQSALILEKYRDKIKHYWHACKSSIS